MGLLECYEQKFRESEQDVPRKGSPQYCAYWQIVQALKVDNPKVPLENAIQIAQEAIARHDLECWHGPRGYRGYYNKEIEIYQQALSELRAEEK